MDADALGVCHAKPRESETVSESDHPAAPPRSMLEPSGGGRTFGANCTSYAGALDIKGMAPAFAGIFRYVEQLNHVYITTV